MKQEVQTAIVKNMDDVNQKQSEMDADFAGNASKAQWGELASGLDELFRPIRRLLSKAEPLISAYIALEKAKLALEKRGIIPHATAPWQLFDENNANAFPDLVLKHYSERWTDSEKHFRDEIHGYQITDRGKVAFSDALRCHSQGLYLPSVLTIMSSIEMEFRSAFEISVGGQAASLIELRKLAKEAPAGASIVGIAPLRLLKILDEHIYQNVKTEADLARFTNDPIPNRHAAIHGIIDYSSELNSLNAIFIAAYVFDLISSLRRYADGLEQVGAPI